MRRQVIPLGLTVGLLALAGCASSPPTQFYTLDPVAPEAGGVSLQRGEPVKVDAVHIPPALDRNGLVRGETGNQLDISSQDRWAGDLGEMIRRVLTQDLASRLPSGMVIAPESPAPDNSRGIVVDILSFQPQASGEIVLDVDWTVLQGTQSSPLLRRSAHLTAMASASAQGEAAAMSELLGRLADEIAAALGTAPPAASR